MCAGWIACSRCFLVDYYCDPGETRTPDILLRRQALYPLSYRAGSSILPSRTHAIEAPNQGGPTPVAVGAANLTLSDLGLDRPP